MIKHSIITLITTLGLTFSANAAVIYDESFDGDLSNNNLMPTEITLLRSISLGSNIVKGTTLPNINPSDTAPEDPDFWSLTIPDGRALTAILLESYSNEDDIRLSQSFFAVSEGREIFSIVDDSDLLGSALIGAVDGNRLGDDVLDDLGQALLGGKGFQGGLGSGSYTFWHQETAGKTSYAFDFQISSVPEPSMILGLLTLSSIGIFMYTYRQTI